nr:transposase [Stenoxybacter acetivorans]
MNIHKRTRLLPYQRQEIWRLYTEENVRVSDLAATYCVSRPTIYKVLKEARLQVFVPKNSTNRRFKQVRYGIKCLAKVEKAIQDKLKAQAQRYNKTYPGEMLHVDTKRLPALAGQTQAERREYLFVGIDDFSRELYAGIYPDKSQFSAADFLKNNVLIRLIAYTRITGQNTRERWNTLSGQ